MINRRMLSIIQYLHNKRETNYKSIAGELGIKERTIRYDIDKINDYLQLQNLPLIVKKGKGELYYPSGLLLEFFDNKNEYVYTQKDRISIIFLMLLLEPAEMKLNKMAKELEVSRSTIKNDFEVLSEDLLKDHIKISYYKYFVLETSERTRLNLLNEVFEKHLDILLSDETTHNVYENKILAIINESFGSVKISAVIVWLNALLDNLLDHNLLTDQMYRYYLSNVLIMIFYIINDKEHPLELADLNLSEYTIFKESIYELEDIIHRTISLKKAKVLVRLLNLTNKYGKYNSEVDFTITEDTTTKLISLMSKALNVSFATDEILKEGLMNHMASLLSRVNQGVELRDNVVSLLSNRDIKLFKLVLAATKKIAILDMITSDSEIAYLTIHFVASMRRVKENEYCKVVIVCGFGYGTSRVLKESLLNEFQVEVVAVLSTYQVSQYKDWNNVDYVIATSPVKLPVEIKLLQANPILSQQDLINIINAGIPRKTSLLKFNTINNSLDFLTDEQRLKVLKVIQKEINHEDSVNKKINNLTDLLSFENIEVIDEAITWQASIHRSANILLRKKLIEEDYVDEIFAGLDEMGFYSITDDSFALLHGNNTKVINHTCMSLLINRQPIAFGDKRINLVFVLASKDKKEHIPAIITWVRMMVNTDVVEKLAHCDNYRVAYEIIQDCQRKIL